jgi:hypothetical protein
MRLDPANSFLPYDRPLGDYLCGSVGAEFLKGHGAWHTAIEFAANARCDSLIAALYPTPLDGSGPVVAPETYDLVSLAGAVRNDAPAPVAEPIATAPAAAAAASAEPEPAVPASAGFVFEQTPAGSAPPPGELRAETGTAPGKPPAIRLPEREAEPFRPRMTFGKAPAAAPPETNETERLPEAPRTAEEAKALKPIPKPEVKLPERAQPVEPEAGAAAEAKPQPRPTLVPPAAPPKPASTVKPAPVPMPKPSVPRPAVVPRPLKGSPVPAVMPGAAAERASAAEEAVSAPRPTLVPDRKPAEAEAPAEPAAPLPVPSFGGAAAAGPALSLTGEALRADQVEVPSGIPGLLKLVVPLLLVAGGGVYYFLSTGSPEAAKATRPRNPGVESSALMEQGWVTEWASDPAGSRRGRQLTLYKPSLPLSDYQFMFSGKIERGALGWVVRASDSKNYYAMKISQEGSGAVFSRWAVVDGRESSYSEKRLALLAGPGQTYQVQVDAEGPRFTVSLQGEPIEVWMDNRLTAGAVGFLNEREEQGRTTAVQLKYAKRPAGN